MMKRLHKLAAIAIAVILNLSFTACSKDVDGDKFSDKKSAVIDTRAYDKWTYFSFEKGVIGTYKESEFDYKNNMEWDIAFHRWDVRTNGGESGKGQGGAFQTNYGGDLNVDIWSTIPSEVDFTIDAQIKTYMDSPNMNVEDGVDQRVDTPANTLLAKWMTVSMSTIPPTYKILDKAFIVRTASGKNAAVLFTNYMNDKAEKGYVNFDYVYPLN